jgi:hypothetical protein
MQTTDHDLNEILGLKININIASVLSCYELKELK